MPHRGPTGGARRTRGASFRRGAAVPGPAATTAPVRIDEPRTDESDEVDLPWKVVVWNDPINLMSYVVYVLRKLFGYSEEEATRLMLAVHHEGRAVVATGPREKSELDCYRLHHHGLWATMEKG